MTFLRCRTCVMPSTRPDTTFIDGECPACINWRQRETIDWDARKSALLQLLDRHDGRCIVPSSGGKDSTYQALTLKSLGADVTAVTARTCHLTPTGRANIDNLARHVRTIEVVPNMSVREKLNLIGLQRVGDISWPEHAAIFSTPFKMAIALGIPLIFYGECPQREYGGPPGSEEAMQMTRRWVTEFGGFLGLRPSDCIGEYGITERDMEDYSPPSPAQMTGLEAHFLGQYLPWDSRTNVEFSMQAGMLGGLPCKANWWAGENMDNLQTYWHDLGMFVKYGYGRGCAQISVDVRSRRVNREDALYWVRTLDGKLCEQYMGLPTASALPGVDKLSILRKFADMPMLRKWDGRDVLKEYGW